MIRILLLEDNAVRLCFFLFSLKDPTKKLLYNLTADSVTSWDDFVKVFLKKFYPIHKITLIRKNIMHFKQDSIELF